MTKTNKQKQNLLVIKKLFNSIIHRLDKAWWVSEQELDQKTAFKLKQRKQKEKRTGEHLKHEPLRSAQTGNIVWCKGVGGKRVAASPWPAGQPD